MIFGGRSEIGTELALRLAPGATVVLLLARGADRLDEQVAAVRAAGAAAVHTREFDADDLASHGPLVSSIVADYGPIGTAVLAFGILGDQARAEADPGHAVAIVHTDYVAQVSLLTVLAATMRTARRGQLVVFSSVAGVRVRRANYVYGSAKAGLDGFASGLADALHGSGVRLLIVRPGFVIGRMTEGMTPRRCRAHPSQVAEATARALSRGRRTVWVPWVAAAGVLRDAVAAAVRVAEDAAMIVVVGIGADGMAGLAASSCAELRKATVVYGSRRQLDLLDDTVRAERREWPSPMLPALHTLLDDVDGDVHVVASGDPIAARDRRTLIRLYGPDRVAVLPHVSSVTLACARVGWAVQDTEVISLVTGATAHRGAPRRSGRGAVPRRRDPGHAGPTAHRHRPRRFRDHGARAARRAGRAAPRRHRPRLGGQPAGRRRRSQRHRRAVPAR